MSGGQGYEVAPEALKELASGIQGAIDALKGMGLGQSYQLGRGFSGLELTGMEASSAGVKSSFDAFCERWSWGVRSLVQDGNEIALRLGLSAGLYHDQEQYVSGVLKDAVSAAIGGNPDQDQSQTEKESWGQVWGDNAFTEAAHPDFSTASAVQAQQKMSQLWKGEQTDLKQLGENALGGPAMTAYNDVNNTLNSSSGGESAGGASGGGQSSGGGASGAGG
jgi:hypothetical protein